ncbi:UNVERIFIED_CONTAM: hypothetical protein GTU68_060462 [Idotea baltica]|nr:hypothetical protein [Idotea baltica]
MENIWSCISSNVVSRGVDHLFYCEEKKENRKTKLKKIVHVKIFENKNANGLQEFHLQNEKVSYIINVLKNGHIGSLYFGCRLENNTEFAHMQQISLSELPISPNAIEDNTGYSLDTIRSEYPADGQGDYRESAISILQPNGSNLTDFQYKEHIIKKGKPILEGLPGTYVENEGEAITLEVILQDILIECELVLSYTIFKDRAAIARNSKITNLSNEELNIQKFYSVSVDFPFDDDDYSAFHLGGTWGREMQIFESTLDHGKISVESKRGTSSSIHQPFIALKKGQVSERSGEVYGLSLVYSGNHKCFLEINQYGIIRLGAGIHPFNFNWVLKPNTSFQSPEAILVYSNEGVSGMSLTYNSLYRERLARGTFRDQVRPILLNTWEATYFDFTEEKLLTMATKAETLGIELFVLDDGWFGDRNHDAAGLGDWQVNLKKLPSGIKGLAEKIEKIGLKFGLWFEPEMVNKDSNLYRKHPDWILEVPGRPNTPSRKQHILDLSRKEVREYVYNSVANVLEDTKVSYVKWDMNRPMTEVMSHSLGPKNQGEVAHRYILGLYEILEQLNANFPDVLFESCASGGNRFDPGMLHYMPQGWTSDNTDAMDRIKIQHGTSIIYPISAMGAHVSEVPNHQTGRVTDLNIRTNVAYFGVFGYELDFHKLNSIELETIRKNINFYKAYREVFQFGDFYRLRSFYKGEYASWISVNKSKSVALISDFRRIQKTNFGFEKLKLTGLNPKTKYKAESTNVSILNNIAYGDELMQSGLIFGDSFFGNSPLTENTGDFKSKLVLLKSIK